jgi:excisionase family DNA binding protein
MQRTENDSARPYSVEEAAEKAGLDSKTVRRAIREGQVVAVRFGRRVLIPRGPYDRLIEEGKVG